MKAKQMCEKPQRLCSSFLSRAFGVEKDGDRSVIGERVTRLAAALGRTHRGMIHDECVDAVRIPNCTELGSVSKRSRPLSFPSRLRLLRGRADGRRWFGEGLRAAPPSVCFLPFCACGFMNCTAAGVGGFLPEMPVTGTALPWIKKVPLRRLAQN